MPIVLQPEQRLNSAGTTPSCITAISPRWHAARAASAPTGRRSPPGPPTSARRPRPRLTTTPRSSWSWTGRTSPSVGRAPPGAAESLGRPREGTARGCSARRSGHRGGQMTLAGKGGRGGVQDMVGGWGGGLTPPTCGCLLLGGCPTPRCARARCYREGGSRGAGSRARRCSNQVLI